MVTRTTSGTCPLLQSVGTSHSRTCSCVLGFSHLCSISWPFWEYRWKSGWEHESRGLLGYSRDLSCRSVAALNSLKSPEWLQIDNLLAHTDNGNTEYRHWQRMRIRETSSRVMPESRTWKKIPRIWDTNWWRQFDRSVEGTLKSTYYTRSRKSTASAPRVHHTQICE